MTSNLLPLILYDINNNVFEKNHIIKNNCFYFYSYQNFDIQIVSAFDEFNNQIDFQSKDMPILYSVKELQNLGTNYLQTYKAFQFINKSNFGYTIYIPKNKTTINLTIVSINNITSNYIFTLKLDNIIDETNEHYLDLLVNNDLPNYEQILPALNSSFDKSEMIKRLLLDFKNVVKYKGTKTSIEKFFVLIGFNRDSLTVFDEFLNEEKNFLTVNPDKTKDIKTGNYHVIYDNQTINGLDSNNFPNYNFTFEDLTEFSNNLVNVIALANRYFTLKEQNIDYFAINYYSNSVNNLSITSTMCKLFEMDIFNFRKNSSIELFNYIDENTQNILVSNCLQKTNKIYRSEVKFNVSKVFELLYNTPLAYNTELTGTIFDEQNEDLFFVDSEIFEDILISTVNLEIIKKAFGNILHLKLKSPGNYVRFKLVNETTSKILKYPKTLLTNNELYLQIISVNTGNYKLTVDFIDIYNNVETYFYEYNVDININRIDFELFDSGILADNSNNLSNDINSSSIITNDNTGNQNYILPEVLIPYDLSQYYQVPFTNDIVKWLSNNSVYDIPDINKNNKCANITNTIPLKYISQKLSIISFKYDSNLTLKLRIFDATTGTFILIDVHNIGNYSKIMDKLFVTIMDVYDLDSNGNPENYLTPYYLIMGTETGIVFNQNTYDFVLVDTLNNNTVTSIYDTNILNTINFAEKTINLTYDLPLFGKVSSFAPSFVTYISSTIKTLTVEGYIYPAISSIYSRLVNFNSNVDSTENCIYSLKIGDIILARINENYVIDEKDVKWEIHDAFTNELIYSTTNYILNYRIEDNSCYHIILTFKIKDQLNTITKYSAFSSYINSLNI